MATTKLAGCMNLVARMRQEDQDAVLRLVDLYTGQGFTPQQAQRDAAREVLARAERQRVTQLAITRRELRHLFPMAERPAKAPADAAGNNEAIPTGEATEIEGNEALAANETPAPYDAQPPAGRVDQATMDKVFAKPPAGRVRRISAALQQVHTPAGRSSIMDYLGGLKEWLITQGLDQYRAAQTKLSERAYMLMRLVTAGDGALEASLMMGKPRADGDTIDVDFDGRGGFLGELATLTKGEHQDFLKWVAAKRAEILMQPTAAHPRGRENLFVTRDAQGNVTENLIPQFLALADGQMADGSDRATAYQAALDMLTSYNESMLRIGVQRGLLSQAMYERLREEPYLPFYRVMEDTGSDIHWSTALTGQEYFKKLTGGAGKLPDDLLSNVIRNWSHVFTAAAKNHASNNALDEMQELGYATRLGNPGDPGTKGSVWTMVGGEVQHWMVHDADLAAAIGAMSYAMPDWQKPLATFKRVLTTTVTSMPGFKLKNPIRDTIQAVALSDKLNANPLRNAQAGAQLLDAKGAVRNMYMAATGRAPKSFLAQTQTFATMLASGGLMRFGNLVEGDRSAHAEKLIRRASGGKSVLLDRQGAQHLLTVLEKTGDALTAYMETTDVGEQINRAALFDAMIKAGMSKAEAAFAARDLMDFSLQGKAPVVRFLVQTVPFLNARLQGLYKLGRAATSGEKYEALGINKRFANVAGSVTMASLALMFWAQDDPDWKEREDWDRDTYWWFKIGQTAYRLPKPFEVGSLGTLAERSWELAFNPDMTGRRYVQRLGDMLSGTFAFNPIPQAVKPLWELGKNEVSFNRRPIETQAMQAMQPGDRFTADTSMAARFLGKLGLPNVTTGDTLSPVQIDHLMTGYFGGLAWVFNGVVDTMARPLMGTGASPAWSLKTWTSSFADELPPEQSRYVSLFYERAKAVDAAYGSYRGALKLGDTQRANELFDANKELLEQRRTVDAVKRELADIAGRSRMVAASRTLDSDAKREALDKLAHQRADIARDANARLPAF